MTAFRRHMGFALALATLIIAPALPLSAAPQDDVQATFDEGVELLRRGNKEDALLAFQRVLAMDPSNDQAYELWKSTDHEIWLEMLVEGGQWEQVAKGLMGLVEMGRQERRDDPDAIREHLRALGSEDAIVYRKALRALAAEHGEYAVPLMMAGLADQVDDDLRVRHMQALTEMGDDVVLPLVEALNSPDAFLRRNVALTLGYIGDMRAAPTLAVLAGSDPDPGVREAATAALAKVGGDTNPVEGYLAQGDAYHLERHSILRPYQFSSAVWSWSGNGLEYRTVPRFLYADELAKKAYFNALAIAEDPSRALAGIARVSVSQGARVAELETAGEDVGGLGDQVAEERLALLAAGPAALDLGLLEALAQSDETAALGLCLALQEVQPSATAGLQQALGHPTHAGVRAEAAVALAHGALRSGESADARVIDTLSDACARRTVHVAAIIDGDQSRVSGLVGGLESRGFSVASWGTGASGLAALYRLPGVDVICIADRLPDLTTDQVLDAIREDPRTAETPVMIVTSQPDQAAELYGEKAFGTVASGEEAELVLDAVMAQGERTGRSDDLARRAAGTLAMLAMAGADVSGAADGLAANMDRSDDVVLPSLAALAACGGPSHVAALADVIGDGERSDEVRVAAGDALAALFARNPRAGGEAISSLHDVISSDAALAVRQAAARALGQLELSTELRADLLSKVRVDLGTTTP